MAPASDFVKRLSRILANDPRYHEEAYLFVMASLVQTVEAHGTPPRHVSGQELLEGIRRNARAQFGPMARTVFEHWGIKNSLDFGHVVFNMVREGILSKTEADGLGDFEDEFFFENLFDPSRYRLPAKEQGAKQWQTKQ